ncbi:MAG: trypsin-like peptidase domain-containing protein [Planctomycetota bacterium]|jgi:serine protease Do
MAGNNDRALLRHTSYRFTVREVVCVLGVCFLGSCSASSTRGVYQRATKATAKPPAVTDDSTENLATLEQKIMAAAEKAKRSAVRFVKAKPLVNPAHPRWFSGVIFTADGYVATFPYSPDHLPAGEAVSIFLADGRLVPGVAVGSSQQWGFGLVKITPDGPWPNAEIGSSSELKLGELCLAVVYPRANYLQERSYDRESSLRLGLVAMKVEGRWLGASTQVGLGEDGGLFDLNGRLIGVRAKSPMIDPQPYATIETVKQHWKRLVNRSAPAKQQAADQADDVAESPSSKALPPVPAQDDPRVAPVIAKAKKVTVRYEPGGCSGVVVTSDGYVATCAHHNLPAGTDITISFGNGREVPGKIVGSDFLLDVGLAKITTPGPWPHAKWGSATSVRPGDLCVGLGYAQWAKWGDSEQRKNWRKEPQVRVGRVQDTRFVPTILKHSAMMMPGASGGGLFDGQGRLIGLQGGGSFGGFSRAAGIDLVKQHWDFLISGGASLGDSVPFGLSPTAEAFRKEVEPLPPIVVEVLGDKQRRALGTIVSTDGYILTKASQLYGSISCRLADGRTLPTTKVKTSAEHDLALLKIDAADLPQIAWSERKQLPVGSFVGAMRYREPPAVSVMALATHSVPPAPGYLVGGKVKDVKDGVEVEELWLNWTRHTLLRKGDVIVHVEGRPTPDLKTFEQITKRVGGGRAWEVPQVIAGDPIRVGVRRDGKDLELRFPLLPVMAYHNKVTLRSCAFPAVFDTDAIVTRDTCGGPLVDRSGEVVGITIALATKERVYVVPAAVARKVADKLKQQ